MNEKDLEKIKIIVEDAVESKTRNFVTKDDIKNLATKEEVKNFVTKDDIKKLEARIDQKIDDKIDGLAMTVAKGFESVDKRFENVEAEMREMKSEIIEMKSDVGELKVDMQEIKGEVNYIGANFKKTKKDAEEMKEHFVYRHEFEDLESRVRLTETKLKIKSGK